MKTIQEVQRASRIKVLAYRAIDRVLHSEEFEEAYSIATPKQRDEVIGLLTTALTITTIKNWINAVKGEANSWIGLKARAQALGIVNWSRLSKAELLSEIAKHGQRSIK